MFIARFLGITLAVFRCKILKIKRFCVSWTFVSDVQIIKSQNFAQKRLKDRRGEVFAPPPYMVHTLILKKQKNPKNEKQKIFRGERKCKCVVVFEWILLFVVTVCNHFSSNVVICLYLAYICVLSASNLFYGWM
jgi:hypothetical protein